MTNEEYRAHQRQPIAPAASVRAMILAARTRQPKPMSARAEFERESREHGEHHDEM